jgi:hypothetical protein
MSKPIGKALIAGVALLLLSGCAPAVEEVAADDSEPSYCERTRATQNASTGGGYERACAVFVSGRDEQLHDLVLQYLDFVQRERGGGMVRTLHFEDSVAAIHRGASHVFERDLEAETTYRFIGACDNECGDLDIRITDSDGNDVAADYEINTNPMVTHRFEHAGRYRIELRMYRCSIEPCYAGLRILEDPQDWARAPTFGAVQLAAGAFADPFHVEVISGGPDNMQRRQSDCAGFIQREPDFRLWFTGEEITAPLIISVQSDADTTLVINGPDALWYCDDDGGALGANPMVVFSPARQGQYDIWVGTYGAPEHHPAVLSISQSMSH